MFGECFYGNLSAEKRFDYRPQQPTFLFSSLLPAATNHLSFLTTEAVGTQPTNATWSNR
jgi:hypothetical protein